jgi:hypothetical protein
MVVHDDIPTERRRYDIGQSQTCARTFLATSPWQCSKHVSDNSHGIARVDAADTSSEVRKYSNLNRILAARYSNDPRTIEHRGVHTIFPRCSGRTGRGRPQQMLLDWMMEGDEGTARVFEGRIPKVAIPKTEQSPKVNLNNGDDSLSIVTIFPYVFGTDAETACKYLNQIMYGFLRVCDIYEETLYLH